MSERLLVDWALAERIAVGLADAGTAEAGTGPFTASALAAAHADALEAVSSYTGLEPAAATPSPELIERADWSRGALAAIAAAASPLEKRLAADLSRPGPFGATVRALAGAGAGAEAGVVVGYAARRVLGQYDFALFGERRPARLLFVGSNLARARAELDAEPDLFLRWIVLHESTHVLQFEAVEWLGSHLRGLAEELIEAATRAIDARMVASAIARLLRTNPRRIVRSALRGELLRALADPEQRRRLDRLQATMAAIEGHAEHVMDACGADEPGLGELRRRLDARRARRGGLGTVIARLLGLELKLRQYEQGKAFFDSVAASGGREGVALAWGRPESLPTPAEIEDPAAWLGRVTASSPVSA